MRLRISATVLQCRRTEKALEGTKWRRGCSQWRPRGSKWSYGGYIDQSVVAHCHHFKEELDPDPHLSEKLDPGPHLSEKLDPYPP